jgi:CBS domain-containing protein
MKAGDVMTTDVPVVSMKTPVAEAVRMLRKNFGDESYLNAAPGLVVVNERGEVAGVLSPLSVMKELLEVSRSMKRPARPDAAFYDALWAAIKDKLVEEIMDWQAISVTEDAQLLDVADLFVKHRFQRIPVVKNSRVVGIIYRSRLLFAMTAGLLD